MTTTEMPPVPPEPERLSERDSPGRLAAPEGIRGIVQGPFLRATGGVIAFPLLVLFFLYFFDEFDTAAFGVLSPQIKRAFHLSTSGFTNLIVINVVVLLVLAVPLGFYGDRLPRTKIVAVSAVIAGAFSLLTGVSVGLLLLVIARLGNGVGLLSNGAIHQSLLSDYYPPEARPRVFATHNNASRWGAIVGSAFAGAIALFIGWRGDLCDPHGPHPCHGGARLAAARAGAGRDG